MILCPFFALKMFVRVSMSFCPKQGKRERKDRRMNQRTIDCQWMGIDNNVWKVKRLFFFECLTFLLLNKRMYGTTAAACRGSLKVRSFEEGL